MHKACLRPYIAFFSRQTLCSLLPPKHVDELLPWYCCWSNELAVEFHLKRLAKSKEHYAV